MRHGSEFTPWKIAMVAGEPSADRQGAALLSALRELAHPRPVDAWGIGGHHMREAGVELLFDSDPWASIGLAETLFKLPSLLMARRVMKRALQRERPDALVLIDAGAFNVPLGQAARSEGLCPVFYYFPPGSWRKNAVVRKGTRKLAVCADRIVTPFPWSEGLLQSAGADAHFVGHPLLDLVKPVLPAAEFYEQFGLDSHRPLVALLPGSRRSEIRHILPALIGAANEMTRRIPGIQFVLALASSAQRALVEEIIEREHASSRLHLLFTQAGGRLAHLAQGALIPPTPQLATSEGITLDRRALPTELPDDTPPRERPGPAPLVICEGLPWDAMARSDLVLTKSGTATLEAMILKKPMVIVYRGTVLTHLEWRLRRRTQNLAHVGLPNILAGERLFAELIQEEATPEAIAALGLELLLQPGRILALKERLVELVRSNLGEPGGVRRAAELLMDLIASRERL